MKIFSLLFLLLSSITFNLYAEEVSKDVSISLSAFNEVGGEHSGLEISVLGDITDTFSGRFSGVLYTGINKAKVDRLFAGYSVTGYLHFGNKYINPYFGLGLFLGETFNCSAFEEENETCEEDFVIAAYPEFGISFNLQNIFIYPYVRRYFDSNSHASTVNAYGLHVGIKF
ncbi:MAG: hypothetical protein HRU20_05940 [Pseudomonadales bacterium]|nr:hypothetical protein [Pseudomonadales bacterium]